MLAQHAADGRTDHDRHDGVREVHGRDAARRRDRHPDPVDQAGAQQEDAHRTDGHRDRQPGQHADDEEETTCPRAWRDGLGRTDTAETPSGCDHRRMDPIDDAILRELTADARLPFRELGARVGLSPNAAANRVRRLVEDRTIRRFTIVTYASPTRPGAGLEVLIEVRLADGTTNEAFIAALDAGFPQVIDAVHVTGSYDYLLHACRRPRRPGPVCPAAQA